MNGRTSIALFVILILLSLDLSIARAQDGQRSFLMGMAYWPPSGENTARDVIRRDLARFLQNTEIVIVQIPWCPGAEPLQVEWMSSVAREANKELAIAVDWLRDSRQNVRCSGSNQWAFADSVTASTYQQAMARIAHEYQPDYFLLGVEVDYYAVIAPKDFPNFLAAYRRTRDQIKHSTPETQVGVSLQYEHMLRIPSDSTTFINKMITAFDGMSDFIGLSVYPFIAGVWPNQIDLEYFEPVSQLKIPLAISETAWPGFEIARLGISVTQGAYVARILEVSNDLGVTFVLWTAMRDVDPTSLNVGIPPWAIALGFWDLREESKPALELWRGWLARSRSPYPSPMERE